MMSYLHRSVLCMLSVATAVSLYLNRNLFGIKSGFYDTVHYDALPCSKDSQYEPMPNLSPTSFSLVKDSTYLAEGGKNCNQSHVCPCCGSCLSEWGSFSRRKALCPVCKTLERQRAVCHDLTFDTPKVLETAGAAVAYFGPHNEHANQLKEATPRMHLQEFDFFYPGYHYSLTTVQADLQDIPLQNKSFDGVILLHVLEHVPDLDKALSELARVVKVGGFIHQDTPCYSERSSQGGIHRGVFPSLNTTAANDVEVCEESRKTGKVDKICTQADHLYGYKCNYLMREFEKHSFNCTYPPLKPREDQRYGMNGAEVRFRCIRQ
mmetsp:Transcript_22050/g.51879  ORF Transcript_22050/g.51879 Transcript_22050/m.51879 type:complete len:321 (-) Transcript_22050:265-1227(-)|eukprot:CAMPEP_0113440470 /NCGR_PEP_ID=MMETSP0014_2-20120614/575_1 /TAXON_ID=2857 /ORGANISM="Nitzschia sp." /LENGTH=320 /DNA_ID=CAMNT_0000331267 /DNA_START=112 /DNA_END=1074 /DNA_ORIENTATION=+ /assembly_acc=CAM_ASM_000159